MPRQLVHELGSLSEKLTYKLVQKFVAVAAPGHTTDIGYETLSRLDKGLQTIGVTSLPDGTSRRYVPAIEMKNGSSGSRFVQALEGNDSLWLTRQIAEKIADVIPPERPLDYNVFVPLDAAFKEIGFTIDSTEGKTLHFFVPALGL